MKTIKKVIILLMILMFFISTCVHANDEMDWKEWRDKEYWEWYTRTTTNDKAYNGNHIVIEKDVIDFYGYWENSYKDFLFKQYENEGKKIFKFIIDESKASYHTLDGAGFIFNANKAEDKISGYVILFREKDVCLYRIDDININTFQTKSNSTLATYGKILISKPKLNTNIHELIVETTPTKIKVTEGNEEIINVDLEYSKHVGNSFGLISSYVQHACSILSKIEFSEFKIELEDFKISILNTDLEGNSISGGYFKIRDEQGNIIKQGKTDKNGNFKVEGIKQGKYTVQQITPPETYILNDNIYEFEVTSKGNVVDTNSGEEIELIIKNDQYKIEIKNKELNTEAPISGSTIHLYDENGEEIKTEITNENGEVTFIGITAGEYTYKQIKVAEKYELNENEYICIVNENGTVEFENEDENTIYNKQKEKEEKVEILNDIEEIKEDNTMAKTIIPKAGSNFNILVIGIVLSIIFSIITFIKMKK